MMRSRPGLEDALNQGLERVAAPGAAAALVSERGLEWEGVNGLAKPSSAAPVDSKTSFLWFSMTKIATATAVMQLVDARAVGLDSAAREFLPDLDGLDPRITVRQLLNHSSGISNPLPLRWIHPADLPGPEPREMLVRLLARYGKPRFEPGDHSAYSNIGYLVLGELISEVSLVPYQRYVIERVLEPIGAVSTGFSFEIGHESEGAHPRRDPTLPILRLLIPRWALGSAKGKWRLFKPFYLDGSAYGGLVGPVGDAALLAGVHLGGGALGGRRILSPESTAQMQRVSTEGKKFDLGLGWFRTRRDSKRGRTHIEHLGGGGGYGAVMRLYPERGLGVVAMANVSSGHFHHDALLQPIEES